MGAGGGVVSAEEMAYWVRTPAVLFKVLGDISVAGSWFFCNRRDIVGLDEETSYQLLDTLEEWSEYLEQGFPYFQEPSP